jgi:hypothetical protein
MKNILLILALALPCAAADIVLEGRILTENGTNILVIGTDRVDFSVIRFHLAGSNTCEIRPDEISHRGRDVFTATSTNDVERLALRAALKANVNNGNVPPGKTSEVLAALIRLQELDDADEADRKKPKK